MNASSRDDVFRELRKQGIKAIKVVAADGSKANGEIRGVRKRMVALAVLATALVVGGVVFFVERGSEEPAGPMRPARSLPRQVIIGDHNRVVAASNIFKLKAEAFLARFAEPGRPFTAPESDWPSRADFEQAINSPILYSEDEITEHIELKRMVVWMEYELRNYLAKGGYASGYIKELIKRQQTEINQRAQLENQLNAMMKDEKKRNDAYQFWLKANAQLQSMGIYQLELPVQLLNQQGNLDLNQ